MSSRPSRKDELQTLPGIGPSLAGDLRALGVRASPTSGGAIRNGSMPG